MVQRTCLDCGETWTLEAGLAHLHAGRPRGLGARAGSTQAGGRVDWRALADSAAELDQEAETIRQLRTCPKCGGDHYKDRRFRTEIG
jgi:hypothetical protein